MRHIHINPNTTESYNIMMFLFVPLKQQVVVYTWPTKGRSKWSKADGWSIPSDLEKCSARWPFCTTARGPRRWKVRGTFARWKGRMIDTESETIVSFRLFRVLLSSSLFTWIIRIIAFFQPSKTSRCGRWRGWLTKRSWRLPPWRDSTSEWDFWKACHSWRTWTKSFYRKSPTSWKR